MFNLLPVFTRVANKASALALVLRSSLLFTPAKTLAVEPKSTSAALKLIEFLAKTLPSILIAPVPLLSTSALYSEVPSLARIGAYLSMFPLNSS